MRDPYSVLGVKRNADADEIKAAWRSKAKSVHPDHNLDDPSATGRFAEVGQAYDVLKDPDKRRRYDKAADMHQTIMQQREAARQAEERAKAARANAEKVMEELARANAQRAQNQSQAQAKPKAAAQSQAHAQTQTNNADEPPVEDAEDMIERIFGSGDEATDAAREKAAAQAKAQAQQQAQQQAQAQAQAQAKAKADAAADTRAEAGSETVASADDNAAKAEPAPKQPLPMQAVELVAALVRRWRGAPPEKAPDMTAEVIVTLDDLIAQNTVPMHLADERDVKLPLEAGMTDGHVVRMKGQGLKMPSPIARGDLVVTVRVARHERFRLEGFDLHTVLAISLEDAVLGTETEVETPGGKVPITIPAWSGSDRSITLDGLGLADGDGGRGALVVELRVVLWEKPDEKVTDLMKHMRHGLYV
ncbi:DnaJ-class molecular chaperone [Neorhizobium huautlense]|uniref:DnaJ-class molecular chaperone n=1 Tax=Neorhizobium huautlense TaxID=67774 RepID=A0ABT9PV25_9HYPH|nr:DnaJ C-terminal domain-containing protein [Neorhizobium huautlense]MDP9838312.1 DnaJ-class molecular chaperone [Neorhizobium huautlense]